MGTPKIVIDEVAIGGTASEYTFSKFDLQRMNYGYVLEEEAPSVVLASGEIISFNRGLRFYVSITFFADEDSECSRFFEQVLRCFYKGGKVYFYPDSENSNVYYEMIVLTDSAKNFHESSVKIVEGKYEMISKKIIDKT